MSIEKLKGAAEAVGGKLFYNRSLGFYEVVYGAMRHEYIGNEELRNMNVQTFVNTFLRSRKRVKRGGNK